jgi:hypothetical protein
MHLQRQQDAVDESTLLGVYEDVADSFVNAQVA